MARFEEDLNKTYILFLSILTSAIGTYCVVILSLPPLLTEDIFVSGNSEHQVYLSHILKLYVKFEHGLRIVYVYLIYLPLFIMQDISKKSQVYYCI